MYRLGVVALWPFFVTVFPLETDDILGPDSSHYFEYTSCFIWICILRTTNSSLKTAYLYTQVLIHKFWQIHHILWSKPHWGFGRHLRHQSSIVYYLIGLPPQHTVYIYIFTYIYMYIYLCVRVCVWDPRGPISQSHITNIFWINCSIPETNETILVGSSVAEVIGPRWRSWYKSQVISYGGIVKEPDTSRFELVETLPSCKSEPR